MDFIRSNFFYVTRQDLNLKLINPPKRRNAEQFRLSHNSEQPLRSTSYFPVLFKCQNTPARWSLCSWSFSELVLCVNFPSSLAGLATNALYEEVHLRGSRWLLHGDVARRGAAVRHRSGPLSAGPDGHRGGLAYREGIRWRHRVPVGPEHGRHNPVCPRSHHLLVRVAASRAFVKTMWKTSNHLSNELQRPGACKSEGLHR